MAGTPHGQDVNEGTAVFPDIDHHRTQAPRAVARRWSHGEGGIPPQPQPTKPTGVRRLTTAPAAPSQPAPIGKAQLGKTQLGKTRGRAGADRDAMQSPHLTEKTALQVQTNSETDMRDEEDTVTSTAHAAKPDSAPAAKADDDAEDGLPETDAAEDDSMEEEADDADTPVAGKPAERPMATVSRPAPIPGRPQVTPRAPAKAENFVEGDHVVYPTHGVGKVERIATEEIAGHKLELIHITFEENRMTLRVPVAKARSAGLRKLATRKMFDEALAILKGRARVKRTMWSRRAQEYEAKINSGDPLAIAEVVRDLHRNAGQPDQSFSERQIYEAAMDRLAAELAALDKTDKPTAAIKLGNFLKTV